MTIKIILRFVFDNEQGFEINVTNLRVGDVNEAIWVLLNTLKAKQVSLVRGK